MSYSLIDRNLRCLPISSVSYDTIRYGMRYKTLEADDRHKLRCFTHPLSLVLQYGMRYITFEAVDSHKLRCFTHRLSLLLCYTLEAVDSHKLRCCISSAMLHIRGSRFSQTEMFYPSSNHDLAYYCSCSWTIQDSLLDVFLIFWAVPPTFHF